MSCHLQQRVCFILRGIYPYFAQTEQPTGGGAERQLSLLADELKSDLDVHFLTADHGQPETVTVDGVTLHKLWNGKHRLRASEPVQTVRAIHSVRTILNEIDPDVTVAREKPWLTALSYGLTRGVDTRFVYNVANDADLEQRYDALPRYLRWLFASALTDADNVIAQTEYQRDVLRQRFDVDSTVVPNGHPAADSQLDGVEREYFLWVGRIEPDQKRPHAFLDLAKRIPSERFVVVGPQDAPDACHRKFTDRAASLDNVEYVGAVDPDEIYHYYNRAIALVNTSRYEGFPNTFLEAWRVGTPVITYSIPLSRYLADESLTVLSGDDDFDRLVDVVQSLRGDQEHFCEISRRSYEYFKKNYQINSVARQFRKAVLQDVV